MKNPRNIIDKLIFSNNLEELLNRAAILHGHYCSGLALGVVAAQRAVKEIGESSDGLEDLIAIVETNNCLTDGIQYVTGCTFGNNSLIFRDIGKIAFSLIKRDGDGIRIYCPPEAKEYMQSAYPDFTKAYNRVVKMKDHSKQALENYKATGYEKAHAVIKMDFEKLFRLEKIHHKIPEYAPSYNSVICNNCGDSVMESRTKNSNKNHICLSCSNEYNQLDGNGITRCN